MSDALKVAVIGASGIGQHHARWHHLCGSHVVAFVGTSEVSRRATEARLREYFGFEGRAYGDVRAMLDAVRPDIVDVSSPPQFHREHAMLALDAGCHVVCEKPLCWDGEKTLDEVLSDGEAVVTAVERAGRLFVMSAQYPAVVPIYRDLYTRMRGRWDRVERLEMEMEVKGRKGPKFREDIWIDLAAHPLSLAMGFMPNGEIDWDTAQCAIGERENRASFDFVTPQGRCAVSFVLRDIDAGAPRRCFGVNGFLVDWQGYADHSGIYRARLAHGNEAIACDDFMHILIAEFTAAARGTDGRVIVPGHAALRNLQYQIALLKRAERP